MGPDHRGIEPTEIALDVIHEDEDLVVLNKPPYLLVHPTRPDQRHTLVNGLAHYYRGAGHGAGIHPVHRLDRDTSGLVLVARNRAAHRRLAEQLDRRELRREYLGWAAGELRDEAGRIDAPIGRHPTQPVLRAIRRDGEPAATRFEVLERYPAATLLRLVLETGRTHQIRVHLNHLGYPLIGDRQYGRRGLKLIGRQALHAERLSCRHPSTGEALSFQAPLPPDLQALMTKLRG